MAFSDADASQPITKAIRQKLRSEIKRTGTTAIMLLQGADDLPAGLTVAHVNRWISGIVKAASQSHVDYVMDRWAILPDNAGHVSPNGVLLPKRGKRFADGAKRIAMTEEMSKLLRAEMVRTGIGFADILGGADDAPEGLNGRIIKGWLYGDVLTTDERYWNFVIARYAALPDGTPVPGPIKKSRKTRNLHVTPVQ